MSEQEILLKRIQDKVQLLLKQQTALQKENLLLKEELVDQKQQVKGHQQNVETLRQQVEVLKMTSGDMSEADKKEFEKRINGYLKEIDRCISMLGQ